MVKISRISIFVLEILLGIRLEILRGNLVGRALWQAGRRLESEKGNKGKIRNKSLVHGKYRERNSRAASLS